MTTPRPRGIRSRIRKAHEELLAWPALEPQLSALEQGAHALRPGRHQTGIVRLRTATRAKPVARNSARSG